MAERPFLIYPIGNSDVDPEAIITFEGVKAVPAYLPEDDEDKWRKGRVIIDFFELNRDGLQADRAFTIFALWLALREKERGDDPSFAKTLHDLTLAGAPHANCARCFLRLCEASVPNAREHFEKAREIRAAISK